MKKENDTRDLIGGGIVLIFIIIIIIFVIKECTAPPYCIENIEKLIEFKKIEKVYYEQIGCRTILGREYGGKCYVVRYYHKESKNENKY